MIRGVLILAAFVSVVLFPWLVPGLLMTALAPFEPLAPLAVGIFADTLYYVPHEHAFPFFTVSGAVLTLLGSILKKRLRNSF